LLQKKITGSLYYLETEEQKNTMNMRLLVWLSETKFTVSRAINQANVEHPMMYPIEKGNGCGYKITDTEQIIKVS
jgi:hypothetical protein